MSRVAAELAIAMIAGLVLAAYEPGAAAAQPATPVPPTAAAPTAAPPTVAASTDDDEVDDIELLCNAEPDSGEAPLHVRFSLDAIMDGGLDGATYTWNFGDGSPPSKERNPEHTYSKPGDYPATVRVVNKKGERGWDEVEIEVEAHQLPAGTE